MPECDNCGSHVTETWVRVTSREGEDAQACPECADSGNWAEESAGIGKRISTTGARAATDGGARR